MAPYQKKNTKNNLNVVLNESERLKKLTNDILDLSKMQSGEMALNKIDFDIHELLLNVVDRFEERIRQKMYI